MAAMRSLRVLMVCSSYFATTIQRNSHVILLAVDASGCVKPPRLSGSTTLWEGVLRPCMHGMRESLDLMIHRSSPDCHHRSIRLKVDGDLKPSTSIWLPPEICQRHLPEFKHAQNIPLPSVQAVSCLSVDPNSWLQGFQVIG